MAVLKGVVLCYGFYNDKIYWPEDTEETSKKALIVVIMLYFAQITFCMALSTIFSDSRMAQNASSILLFVPLIFVLAALQNDSTYKWLIYPLFLMPVTPPIVLLMKMSSIEAYESLQIFDLNYVDVKLTWWALIVSVPFWFCVYLYFDTVMPNEYGINKHPCFCFYNNKEDEAAEEDADNEAPAT